MEHGREKSLKEGRILGGKECLAIRGADGKEGHEGETGGQKKNAAIPSQASSASYNTKYKYN